VKHEIHRVRGDGNIEVPLVALYSRKTYHIEVETEQPEAPETIAFDYMDCRAARTHGGKTSDKTFSIETPTCPDGDIEGPGKRWYQGTVRLEPVKGAWSMTISEDLNNRGNQNTTTMPILVETVPDEP
jgi:hypothetical protein